MYKQLMRWLQHKQVGAKEAETLSDESRRYYDAKAQAFGEVIEHLTRIERFNLPPLTIGECVDVFGFTLCPTCGAKRAVNSTTKRGQVEPCAVCPDRQYWNLFAAAQNSALE